MRTHRKDNAMPIRIALAGNPNSGKTTLFNALTGANQFVGNWPGVTVEKKEGRLKGNRDVIITDLPGIYSLSPYTMEEVISRDYIIDERPDAVINVVDATNIERSLYLTLQLAELGTPMVVALNMMDEVRALGDSIDIRRLESELGVPVVPISASRNRTAWDIGSRAIPGTATGGITAICAFAIPIPWPTPTGSISAPHPGAAKIFISKTTAP